eukprot:1157318-Pelagomonas_calceolata.AAC.3
MLWISIRSYLAIRGKKKARCTEVLPVRRVLKAWVLWVTGSAPCAKGAQGVGVAGSAPCAKGAQGVGVVGNRKCLFPVQRELKVWVSADAALLNDVCASEKRQWLLTIPGP